MLLTRNYVEDDDAMFRFDYSIPFLKWALQVPGQFPGWILGVVAGPKKKLYGFISAIPVHMSVNGKNLMMAEINFLCVHKHLRAHRMAPILIKEITRRVNM
jgi:glycylpeptide N-tetradecanoyltransferase